MNGLIDPVLLDRLSRYAARRRRWVIARAVLVAAAVWIASILIVTWVDAAWILERGTRAALTLAAYAAAAAVFAALCWGRLREAPLRHAALAMEGLRPEMRDRLLSVLEMADAAATNREVGSAAFIQAAQRDAALRLRRLDIRKLLPLRLLRKPMTIAIAFAAISIALVFLPELHYGNRFARAIIPGIDLDRVSRTRIEILRPQPSSGAVPADELTPLAIRTHGTRPASARVQWRSDDGRSGSILMNRLDAHDGFNAADDPGEPQFAVNLPVARSAVRYRILAGDGVTAWHRLDPVPRPSAIEFHKQITPPAYTLLPPLVETAEHGELTGPQNSTAEVTVTFDAPVTEAQIRLLGDDERIPMVGVGETWKVTIPLIRDDRYQVLARGLETGFDNSLSPQYPITAVTDQPPQAVWLEQDAAERHRDSTRVREGILSVPKRHLITSRSTVDLAAAVTDEMPVKEVFQEAAINVGPFKRLPEELPRADETVATTTLNWTWDPEQLAGETTQLRPGDLIRTRVVAIDRKGQRGESSVREFLISDREPDARRRANVRRWSSLVEAIQAWQKSLVVLLEEIGLEEPAEEATADAAADADRGAEKPFETLSEELSQRLAKMTREALHDSEAGEIELLARAVERVRVDADRARRAEEDELAAYRSLRKSAELIEHAASCGAAHRLAVAVTDDFDRMVAAMQPLLKEDSTINWQSFGRYHQVTQQQFRDAVELMSDLHRAVPASARSHNEQLRRWIEQWQRRLLDNSGPDAGEARVRGATRDLVNELSSRRRTSMVDGRLPSMIIDAHNRLNELAGWTAVDLYAAHKLAGDTRKIRDRNGDNDSERARDAVELEASVRELLGAIARRLRRDAEMNLRRPEADRRYVADARMLKRVLDIVADEQFVPPDDMKFDDVLEELAVAYHQLEAGHWWTQRLVELRVLADNDRWEVDTAAARLDAPMRWSRVQRGLEHAHTGFDRARVPWEVREPLQREIHSRETNRLAGAINARRSQASPTTSLADALDARHAAFTSAGQSVAPTLSEARKRIEAYLPSLSELARDAADRLRQAEREARQQEQEPEQAEPQQAEPEQAEPEQAEPEQAESEQTEPAPAEPQQATSQPTSEPSARRLAELQQQAGRLAERLREALTDEANTQDLTTEDGLRNARNADIASRAVEQQVSAADAAARQAVRRAEQAADPATAADALREAADPIAAAAETLEEIARHYEAAERAAASDTDEDRPPVSPSLERLEQQLNLSDRLDDEFARSRSLAETLNSDPRELLKKLSEELNRNEPMQQELDRIAEQSLADARRSLREQAERERQLRLELERNDPQLLARKRELEDILRDAADNTSAVHRSMLHAAKQAASRLSELPEPAAEAVAAAREQLQTASSDLQRTSQDAASTRAAEQELLADLLRRAEQLGEQLEEAVQTLQQTEKTIGELTGNPEAAIEGDRKKAEQRDMQNFQRQARDALSGAVRNRQNRAGQAVNNAQQNLRQAQNQMQQTERALNEANKRVEQNPEDAAATAERDRVEARKQLDQQRVELAQEELERRRRNVEQVKQRVDEVSRTPAAPLDSDRPAAELSSLMQKRAVEQLQNDRRELAEAVNRLGEPTPVNVPDDVLTPLAQSQSDVRNEVGRAAENLQRVARHRERLGDRETAEAIDSIAEAVGRVAENEAGEALRKLAAAAEAARQQQRPVDTSDAHESLEQAETAIGEQAASLAAAEAEAEAAAAEAAAGDPSAADADSGQRLARTLDEIDRSLNQSRPPAPSEAGDQAGEEPGGEPGGEPGDAQPGEGDAPEGGPGEDGAQPGDGTDADRRDSSGASSPTLDAEARRRMQQMAMQRTLPGEAMPSDGQAPTPGESADGDTADGQPGEGDSQQSGDGADGVDPAIFRLPELADADAGDWGRLREMEAEDTTTQRRSGVSPEYRAQVEAYFRAIAEQSKSRP